MTLDEARARFATMTAAEDATESPISTADRDSLLLQAYIEIESTYGSVQTGMSAIGQTSPTFNVGAGGGAMISQVLAGRGGFNPATILIPLIRTSYGAILKLHGTEGATGTPRQFGAALVQHNPLTPTSTIAIAIYPFQSASYDFALSLRRYTPELDLAVGGTVLRLDEPMAEYVVRLAAYWGCYVIGYDDAFLNDLVTVLPDGLKVALDLDHRGRYPGIPPGMAPKPGERAAAEASSGGRSV